MFDLRLDHVGVQVADLDQAAALFEGALGYHRATLPVTNSLHGVRGIFMVKPGSVPIKLITPIDPGDEVFKVGTHHLAFMVDDIDEAVTQLRFAGARLLKRPRPGEMFDGKLIAFLSVAGVNVELVTTRQWRNRIESGEGLDDTPPGAPSEE